MILDARQQIDGSTIRADACIVGAGAAGIAIARELIGSRTTVCIFESGGFSTDQSTKELNRAPTNNPYDIPLDESRSRVFGGTTRRWSGWCRPLDPSDFEQRDWIPESGWPFGYETMAPYYDRARVLCEVSPADLERRKPTTAGRKTLDLQRPLINRSFELSPPTDFGVAFRSDLEKAANVNAYLNATAVALHTDEAARRIETLELRTLSGKTIFASARVFILAAGGIENARLLLATGLSRRHAIGNENDLVGRYYMDHLAFFSGVLPPGKSSPPLDFYTTPFDGRPSAAGPVSTAISLDDSALRDGRLLGAVLRFVERPAYSVTREYDSAAVASARQLAAAISSRRVPDRASLHLMQAIKGAGKIAKVAAGAFANSISPGTQRTVRCLAETAPDRNNRVSLSNDRDSLGLPRASLSWNVGDLERRSITELHDAFATEATRLGLGTLLPINDDFAPTRITGASHHIGTTRMHESPRNGVVDGSSRVHEIGNLYVAGSSVFPTCGYANPTLTIIALAIRLADHLKGEIAKTA